MIQFMQNKVNRRKSDVKDKPFFFSYKNTNKFLPRFYNKYGTQRGTAFQKMRRCDVDFLSLT